MPEAEPLGYAARRCGKAPRPGCQIFRDSYRPGPSLNECFRVFARQARESAERRRRPVIKCGKTASPTARLFRNFARLGPVLAWGTPYGKLAGHGAGAQLDEAGLTARGLTAPSPTSASPTSAKARQCRGSPVPARRRLVRRRLIRSPNFVTKSLECSSLSRNGVACPRTRPMSHWGGCTPRCGCHFHHLRCRGEE
jgi:hypothetical protein